MRNLRALLLLPLAFGVFITVDAQATLEPGTPIERTLGPGQVHDFTVTLEENTMIQLVVEQRGIDVIVRAFSPAARSLGEFDSPNGADGPENVSFIAVAAGAYRITVSPVDPASTTTGRYEIKILEMRKATDQEIRDSKNLEAVKAKGIALLTQLDAALEQVKAPQTRIRAQLQIAQLLAESDEKQAMRYLADAAAAVKEYQASLDANDQRYPQQYSTVTQLRMEVVRALSVRDPDAALDFVRLTPLQTNPYGNQKETAARERELELTIANQLVSSDPNRTLQLARRSMRNGYSSGLISTLQRLRIKNPELATQLGNEIAAKLLNEKLLNNPETAILAVGLLRTGRTPGREPRPRPPMDSGPSRLLVLGDDEYRRLLQKALNEALSYSPPSPRSYTSERDAAWNILSGLQWLGGPEIDTILPGSAAAVEKKLAELSNTQQQPGSPNYRELLDNIPVEAAMEEIEKAPQDMREQLYIGIASRVALNGDIARARQIVNDHVTSPYQRRNALMNLEQQMINQAMTKGKVEDALRNVAALRSPRERAMQLAQIAGQIGPGLKRATAIGLLEQVRGLLSSSPQAQDQDQMSALLQIARAFARYDQKRAFEILDPLIDQLNDLCTAARTLEGFGPEYYEDDELALHNGSSVASVANQVSNVLGALALLNFERARVSSDRLRLPEVRLKAYLEIAQQTIAGEQR